MISVALDIETIPGQNNRQQFIDAAIANYKPPSSLTKEQACFALRYTKEQAKAVSKAEAVELWAKEYGALEAEGLGEHEWRKTALDGTYGEVISIAWAVDDGDIDTVCRNIVGDTINEKEMMRTFFVMLTTQLNILGIKGEIGRASCRERV